MSPRTRHVLPTIEPIVPVNSTPLLHDPQWIYEPKFDGFRGVLYVSSRECYIRSKRGKVLSRFADLALRVGAELHARDAILDGEVVALDDEGRMDFREEEHRPTFDYAEAQIGAMRCCGPVPANADGNWPWEGLKCSGCSR